MSEEFRRPQSPGRIIEVLAREGHVTPTEADRLRRLSEKRNKLIHGELQVRVSREEIQGFVAILDTLLHQLAGPVSIRSAT
jgi:uncharacterized protein YutE (UPF0331/DUF86 family)